MIPNDILYAAAYGCPVHVSHFVPEFKPKIQISLNCVASPAFRARMNAWLHVRFGEERVFYVIRGGIFANPANVDLLWKEIMHREQLGRS